MMLDGCAPSASRTRDLLLPGRRAREHRARDVGAGDQQHEADHREQREQRAADAGDDFVHQRPDGDRQPGVRSRVVALEPRRRSRLTSCCACATVTPGLSRPKTRSERPSRSSRRRVERQRCPELRARLPERREPEVARHDADDGYEAGRRRQSRGRRCQGRRRSGAATSRSSARRADRGRRDPRRPRKCGRAWRERRGRRTGRPTPAAHPRARADRRRRA